MPEKREHTNRHDDEYVRCFRCGQLYLREHIRVLDDDCPAAFRGQSLCSVCAKMVKGKKGTGWWAAPAMARR